MFTRLSLLLLPKNPFVYIITNEEGFPARWNSNLVLVMEQNRIESEMKNDGENEQGGLNGALNELEWLLGLIFSCFVSELFQWKLWKAPPIPLESEFIRRLVHHHTKLDNKETTNAFHSSLLSATVSIDISRYCKDVRRRASVNQP